MTECNEKYYDWNEDAADDEETWLDMVLVLLFLGGVVAYEKLRKLGSFLRGSMVYFPVM